MALTEQEILQALMKWRTRIFARRLLRLRNFDGYTQAAAFGKGILAGSVQTN